MSRQSEPALETPADQAAAERAMSRRIPPGSERPVFAFSDWMPIAPIQGAAWPQYRVAVPPHERDVDARWGVNANRFVMARGVEKQISGLNYQWLRQRRDHS